MTIPKIFISYSHDSLEHKRWVLELGSRLRNNGIDAILDQWELSPGDDLPHFMETNLASANIILMICSERYVTKANQGEGGVGYEKMIITSTLMSKINENKIVPLIRQKGTYLVPTFLKTKLFIDFSKNDDYEFSFDELIRKIHNSPIYVKPKIGNNPFNNINEQIQIVEKKKNEHKVEPLKEIMKIVAQEYENGANYTLRKSLVQKLKLSRIMLDLILAEGVAKKLFTLDGDGDLHITNVGKHYAVENNIV